MSIEITVRLIATTVLRFDVEPGEVVTEAMVSDKIDSLQRHLDKYDIDAGDCSGYVHATDFHRDALDAYNRETGDDFTITVGAPAVALPDGFQVRHDMHGFYACTAEEAAHEDEGNNSVGFDGRPHFDDLMGAWAHAATLA
jgi:hypothetical protein